MILSLAPIYLGGLAAFRNTLVLQHDKREAIDGRALFTPEMLDRMLDHSAGHFGRGDKRALASLWAIDYVHVLMPVVVVAALVLGRRLPTALDEIALILDDENMPAAIKLKHDGDRYAPNDAFARFETLVKGHLAPAFAALSAHSGVSPRVLWTNAANLYEAIIRSLEKAPLMPQRITMRADALVTSAKWPDGSPNPFYKPVTYTGEIEGTQRWRRVCCVRYLLDGYEYCSNCPRKLADCRKSMPELSASSPILENPDARGGV